MAEIKEEAPKENKPFTSKNPPSKEQIAEWRKQFSEVYCVTVEDKKAWLKKPTRQILGLASTVSKGDPVKYNETILTNCWIAGDNEIKTDDDYFLAASSQLSEIITFKTAEIKKA